MATVEIVKYNGYIRISIHTTLAGGDLFAYRLTDGKWISIHTTLAGGDLDCFGRPLGSN